uniref:Derlin n=1 Tax=Coccolithus braarudii TaxID=221442 RepID=A0A7S0LPC9_9EUKA|mmetsp:Transcript_51458/g.109952  ORF Transcript_51458/g.109952 Transcript_51458/m.109952 type:complete len:329 (+) Transcript_51458:17-1003(+)|eukprot:CAMPEP_0183359728 /NCGR_PEP_ID=MMETSP0164_2-20130417/53096_1 /TAXON_ID=221442 /ORGANISM="Coccolithus pelagicus ssp braarudi, Strain PLY182g" /LENGTH=328 /DNA_ID=CAMNT_0025533909 /DNA_START=17 /DNA_END=1003 /DNA_ORIENTATION=-
MKWRVLLHVVGVAAAVAAAVPQPQVDVRAIPTRVQQSELPDFTPQRRISPSLTAKSGIQEGALRLRGGGAEDLIGSIQGAYLGVPLVSRFWLSLVLSLAVGHQATLLTEDMLSVDGAAITGRLELWRPVTAASFLGGVSPQLLQKLYYLISFGKEAELTLGAGEYTRALFSSAACLTMICHLLGWPFSADGVIMAVTVICTLQKPDQQVSMYGLKIPYQFFPLAQLALSYMFTQQIPWTDMAGLFVGYGLYQMNDNLKPDTAVAGKLAAAAPATKPGARSIGGAKGGPGGGNGGGAGTRRAAATGGATKRPARKSRINKVTSSCDSGG